MKDLHSEYNIARHNWSRYTYSRDRGHIDWVKAADRNEKFYLGDQWSREARLALGTRPALTVNVIFSIVELMCGQQLQTQADIVYMPKGHGTMEQATVMTKLVGRLVDITGYHNHEAQAFFDGIVMGRGYIELRWETDDHVRGEPRIFTINPKHVIPDPDAETPAPDQWNDVIITRYHSLSAIEAMYGADRAEEIRNRYAGTDHVSSQEDGIPNDTFGGDSQLAGTNYLYDAFFENERGDRFYRIVERQHRKRDRNVKHFLFPTGDIRRVPASADDEYIANIIAVAGAEIMEKDIDRIRWTVSTQDTLLMDSWSPYRHFSVIPYFPHFQRGRTTCPVDQMISPQELINKMLSQSVHIINTSANSGWLVPSGSLINKTIEELQESGAETGLVLEFDPAKDEQKKITPNQIPAGIDRLFNIGLEATKEVSGASDAARGFDSAEVSGFRRSTWRIGQRLLRHRHGVGFLQPSTA